VAIAALVCAVIAAAVPVDPVRAVAAVPLALVFPGYAVTAACFTRSRPDAGITVMLTFGLSLAVLALGTVALHVLPGRFGEASWLVLLVGVVIEGCVIADWRRPWPGRGGSPARFRARVPMGRVGLALIGFAVLAVAATAVLASTLLPARDAIGYTRLWMLPSEEGAGEPHISIGVVNQEQDQTIYRLVIRVGNRKSVRRMDLDPGEQRVWRVVDLSPRPGEPTRVKARLFRKTEPFDVYRRVYGWIPPA